MLLRRLVGDERGGVLALVALAMVGVLGAVGLALDSGRGYVRRAELTRAVDASSLSAARALRKGRTTAEAYGRAVAAANGVDPSLLSFSFGEEPGGDQTVSVTATDIIPTTFAKVLGFRTMTINALAVSAAPPVDLILVLDQSGSMKRERCGRRGGQSAWDCLQDAANTFVGHFDENMDQLGLVTFQLRGTDRFPLNTPFVNGLRNEINNTVAGGDTNPGEALRLAHDQLRTPQVRATTTKVVVFFTDGRPTAFRGTIAGQDRMLAVPVNGRNIRGYFDDPDRLPSDRVANPNGCGGSPSCHGWIEDDVRAQAISNATVEANAIRGDDIFIYTIGLGDLELLGSPDPETRLLAPDTTWLRQLANEGGLTNPDQPKGRAFFVESGEDLEEVFTLVAEDLLVRLTR